MKTIVTVIFLIVCVRASAQNELYNNGAILYVGNTATLQINGSFTNTSTSTFSNNGTCTITGNITNDQVMSGYTGKIVFNNTVAQTVNGASSFLTKDVEINNAAGLTLNTTLNLDGVCTFTNGLFTSSLTAPLRFTTNATIAGVSDASHVNGYVVKDGTGSFTYPVGDASRYEKVTVNTTANGSGMRVNYNPADAGSAPFAGSPPLLYYNKLEYWDIAPLSSATGSVTVYWDDYNNVGIGSTADLRVAHRSSGTWINEGVTSVTGTISAGSVTSGIISSWSPFTLGSISNNSVLPVKWISVNASLNTQKQATISWSVSEQNIDQYEVEKSSTGDLFTGIGSVISRGDGEHEYAYTEPLALQASAFYRVKQVDRDGKFTYSPIVNLSADRITILSVYPSPFRQSFTVNSPIDQTVRLTTVDGRLISILSLKAGSNYVNPGNLSNGIYLLTSPNGITQKIIKH